MYLFLKDRFIHSKKNRRPKIVIFVAAAVFLFFSCRSESVVYSEWLMGTHCSIRFYGKYDPRLPKRCFDAIREIEQTISATDPQSEVSLLNQGEMHPFSPLLSELMGISYKAAAQFDGLFSPGLGRLTALWGFSGEAPRKPADDEIAEALRLSVLPPLKRAGNGTAAAFGEKPLCAFDFGAVGKGYAGDFAAETIRTHGIGSAILSLGGNIQAVGSRPDGTDWRIGLRSPWEDGTLGVLRASDCAVVTSGGYENYFEDEEGNVYWHILDPATGYPADSGLASVTIVCPQGRMGDALSTALFVMGPQKAEEYWRENEGFEMILVTQEGELLITEELSDRFTLSEGRTEPITVLSR